MNEYLNNLWGVVLAGGEGTRLQSLVKRIYGYDRPKQYCTFVGTRSLIRHTIDRVSKVIPQNRIVTVTNRSHSEYVREELTEYPSIISMEQPFSRDTGAGIMLPVLKVYNNNRDSIVALFPSDHFIVGESKFMEYVRRAAQFVNLNPEAIVMLGVKTDKTESGYGWIEPDQRLRAPENTKLFRVKRFWEKPSINVTKYLVDKGCIINTFVLVGKTSAFLYYMAKNMPELYRAFEPIKSKLGTPVEKIMINRAYRYLPTLNFSKAVLENISRYLAVLEMSDVYWSDWGEEYRLLQDLENLTVPNCEPALAE